MSGPTHGAREGADTTWAASPRLARVVQVVLFLVPIALGWLAVRLVGQWFWAPNGPGATVAWLAQAIVVGGVVAVVFDRQTSRFLPLATLLGMSLTFPDEAPSRFGIALRTGTVRKLEQRINNYAEHGLSDDEATAATEAIELITMLGKHERLTRGHTERVRAYADLIAIEMGVSDEDRQKLAWAVLLHDIGKLTVPSEILNKAGRPNDEEWKILQNHPAAGEAFVAPLANWLGSWRYATSQHHERWDGKGYPKGIGGERITLAGRITAVADAYDVITSKRSYKDPISHEDARKELVACSGSQFDPAVVRAFLAISLDDRRSVGFFGGVMDLPFLANVGVGASAAPAIAAVTVASMVTAALTGTATETIVLALDAPASTVTTAAPTTTSTPTTTTRPATTGPPHSVMADFTIPSSIDLPTTETTSSSSTTTVPSSTTTAVLIVQTTTTAPPSTTTTVAPTTTTEKPTTTTTVPPTDEGPVAVNDSASTPDNRDKMIKVLRNDDAGPSGAAIDEATLRIVSGPAHGIVEVDNGHVHYQSEKNFDGVDTFIYEICDKAGACSTAKVTVTVDGS